MNKIMDKVQPENFIELGEVKTAIKDGLTVLTSEKEVRKRLQAMADEVPDDLIVTSELLPASRKELSNLRQARYALQNISKENQSSLNSIKKGDKEKYDDLISIIEPKEVLLRDGVKLIEEEKKNERLAKANAEKERIAAITTDVNSRTNEIINLAATCQTDQHIEDLKLTISLLNDEWLESLVEFEYMGHNLIELSDGYLNGAIENVAAKKRVIQLEEEKAADERERIAIEKANEKAAKIENEKRLKELAAETKKAEDAQSELAKIVAEQRKKEDDLKKKKLYANELADSNKYCKKLHEEQKKLGLKVVKLNKFKDLNVANKFIDAAQREIEREMKRQNEKLYTDSIKLVKSSIISEVKQIEVLNDTIDLKVRNLVGADKSATELVNQFQEEINSSIVQLIELLG